MKSDKRKQSSHNNSIDWWLSRLARATPKYAGFTTELLREEAGKQERLKKLAAEIGLPIYPVHEFRLPEELARFQSQCLRITSQSGWRLALRLSRADSGRITYRNLGIDVREACQVALGLSQAPAVAVVTPYRTPERSGTFCIANGRVVVELAFGPHTWISKPAPAGVPIARCEFGTQSCTIEYSTKDSAVRELLFRSLDTVSALVCGMGVPHIRDYCGSAYAEYHWHAQLGYRFIECSFSRAWAGY